MKNKTAIQMYPGADWLSVWRMRLSSIGAAALVACGGSQDSARPAIEEDVADAAGATTAQAVDWGYGVNVPPGDERARAMAAAAPSARPLAVPLGGAAAGVQGVFGPKLAWPLMPIHQVLLPDGRVLTYGSDTKGNQGGALNYAVWDPSLGTGDAAFMVLPTVTATDIFCAGQALLPDTGEVLIVGGTQTIGGERGYGNSDANLFSGGANAISALPGMAYRRWYATSVVTPDGRQLVLGGRMDKDFAGDVDTPPTVASYANVPEIFTKAAGWTSLTGALSDDAYGGTGDAWYYPRAWISPGGKVFIVSHDGAMFNLSLDGSGSIAKLKATTDGSSARLQSVMYAPGKILSLRDHLKTVLIDINGKSPVVTATAPTTRTRQFGNATLLADGKVFLNGGGLNGNVIDGGEYYTSEIWDPATATFTDAATASVARLYHSSSLLLPDATVATGGGGDPGPVKNLNAEIYYPPYLYLKDGSGQPAPRPGIVSAPGLLGWAQSFSVQVSSTSPISRVTLVRTGVITHVFNTNQRFQELSFTQKGTQLTLKTPASRNIAPPGFYMLFVFDANGVPSVAKIIQIFA